MSTRLLYVQKAFFSIEQAKEALDMALAAASLDLQVSLLFMDDGVFQLIKPTEENLLSMLLKAFPFYDIETIYIVRESISERNLAVSNLILPVTCLFRHEIRAVLDGYNHILS